jgi:hypothetical protein
MLPGIIDVQSATNDDPDAVPARVHIQIAERIRWMEHAHELPMFANRTLTNCEHDEWRPVNGMTPRRHARHQC